MPFLELRMPPATPESAGRRKEIPICTDFRLLDFLKLTEQLKAGKNRFGIRKRERKEIFRLESLFYQLLPEKHSNLIEKAAVE